MRALASNVRIARPTADVPMPETAATEKLSWTTMLRRGKNYPPNKTFLKPFIFKGKTSVNFNCSARTKEETPRHYPPCKATARYCFNCSGTICGGLDHVDFCGLVALSRIRCAYH